MAEATLEERVSVLERLMAHFLQPAAQVPRQKDWRRTVGMFDGDPIMQEIIAEGRRLREEDRHQGQV